MRIWRIARRHVTNRALVFLRVRVVDPERESEGEHRENDQDGSKKSVRTLKQFHKTLSLVRRQVSYQAGTSVNRNPSVEQDRYRGERATGIEPAWPAWKAGTLPLSYARDGSG